MYKKICNRCNKPSYGSSEIGEWLCPVCNHDLTQSKLFIASEPIIRPLHYLKAFQNKEITGKTSKIDLTV
ncbi:hypothetical protein [Bacillus sp. PS06]|uniref:hypothetical protein n=1 Tax=Bacillus sp. PS06 TaxID=2764176 RepID=UPI0017850F58|nr:hypothetical protein [Bacillus sp. PS06]MBD8071323.1 hypothetical protein [Bacillus sp. PS06]